MMNSRLDYTSVLLGSDFSNAILDIAKPNIFNQFYNRKMDSNFNLDELFGIDILCSHRNIYAFSAILFLQRLHI